ncbi:hypothetical protein F2Q69_00022691 [Brassica cretica]|uniref:Reverse transcriptase domain-containing protein n=1 Tax=Brassica cretica TaxID=69181 RepID=A0A8S9QLJ7_BRACR|nr:hypothetical protein F2Q69_00022691 [Brassica cretica]
MESFAGMSGLLINAAKSQMFVAGQELALILSEAAPRGIPVGNLPICYLGMPLTTKSLTAQEYEPLIDKDSLEEEQTRIGVRENERRHQMTWKSADQHYKIIDKQMRNRIISLKYSGQHQNAGLLQRWLEIVG